MRHLLALALLLPGSAFARSAVDFAPPVERPVVTHRVSSLIVEPPDLQRITLISNVEVREVGETAIVKLTLLIGSTGWFDTARMAIALPPEANIVGLTYERGLQEFVAEPVEPEVARRQFDRVVSSSFDPALLEHKSHTLGYERYKLSVFPVSYEQRTVANLTFTMPRFERLTVTIAGKREVIRGGNQVEPTAADQAFLARTSQVSVGQSLYAAPPVPSVGKVEVANYIQSAQASFKRCYNIDGARTAQDVIMRFTIGTDGRPRNTILEGADHFMSNCIARVVDGWQFRETDEAVAVKYPLHFVPR